MVFRAYCLVLVFILIATPFLLFGQDDTCSKLILFPLRSRSFDVAPKDRTDLNVYHFCKSGAQDETELRESGIDLSVLYDAANTTSTDPARLKKLTDWGKTHCPEYRASRFAVGPAVTAVLDKAGAQVQKAYAACLKAPVGLSCYAAPVGARAISLLFVWRPQAATSDLPDLISVRAAGVADARDLLDGRIRNVSESETMASLQHLRVPQGGLVRGLVRLDPAAEITFSATSTAGNCTTETLTAAEGSKQPGVFALEPVDGGCGNDGCSIGLNSDIWVRVADLQKGLAALAAQKKLPDKADIADLVPVIDGIPIPGVNPLNPGKPPEEDTLQGQVEQRLRFHLDRIDGNEANKQAWSRLLTRPVLKRPVEFTLGFENGATLYSWLTKDNPNVKGRVQLIVVPKLQASIGLILIGGALFLFLFFAGRTDLIRDTATRRRPDGRNPFSLARTQMAFWFFLVAASYFAVWMITGDKDTITSSVLTLIGISAATALGAAVVDAGKTKPEDLDSDVVEPGLRADAVTKLKTRQADAQTRLAQLMKDEPTIPANDTKGLEANRQKQAEERKNLERIARQIDFFSQPPWRRAMNDLLSDRGAIGFHRFQIFVWTLVLGIIFVVEVFSRLTMPEFSTTLLAIMGISGGTYIGFKLPDAKTSTMGER